MPKADISPAAKADLLEIAEYTVDHWDDDQALRYGLKLNACFQRLASRPLLGRSCDNLGLGIRRSEQGSHVVFYRMIAGGIRILRVLHKSMQPEHHMSEE